MKKTTEELNQIADEICNLTKEVENSVDEHCITLGEKLSKAKEICYRDKIYWNEWVKENINLSKQHCDRLIYVYQNTKYMQDGTYVPPKLPFTKIYDLIKIEKGAKPVYRKITVSSDNKELDPKDRQINELKEKVEELENDRNVLQRDLSQFGAKQESSIDEPVSKEDTLIDQLIDFLEGAPRCPTCETILLKLKMVQR